MGDGEKPSVPAQLPLTESFITQQPSYPLSALPMCPHGSHMSAAGHSPSHPLLLLPRFPARPCAPVDAPCTHSSPPPLSPPPRSPTTRPSPPLSFPSPMKARETVDPPNPENTRELPEHSHGSAVSSVPLTPLHRVPGALLDVVFFLSII